MRWCKEFKNYKDEYVHIQNIYKRWQNKNNMTWDFVILMVGLMLRNIVKIIILKY